MTVDKQIMLQRINNEINQLKSRINAIIEDDTKDDFLSYLENDIGKAPLESAFPNKTEKDLTVIQQELLRQLKGKNNGTPPLGSGVPEMTLQQYLQTHFKYCNEYIINQTRYLLNNSKGTDDIKQIEDKYINTAYLIVVTRSILYNNYKKNTLPYFYNAEIFINVQEEVLKIRTTINIDTEWLNASISHYASRMGYKITRISIN